MIPSIEEILAGLLSGRYTKEQATGWLHTHMDLARDAGDASILRDEFAGKALQGWYSNPVVFERYGFDTPRDAKEAYLVADAMMAARAAPPAPCAHKWKTTQQGQTYADVRCETCGKTERQSWD